MCIYILVVFAAVIVVAVDPAVAGYVASADAVVDVMATEDYKITRRSLD